MTFDYKILIATSADRLTILWLFKRLALCAPIKKKLFLYFRCNTRLFSCIDLCKNNFGMIDWIGNFPSMFCIYVKKRKMQCNEYLFHNTSVNIMITLYSLYKFEFQSKHKFAWQFACTKASVLSILYCWCPNCHYYNLPIVLECICLRCKSVKVNNGSEQICSIDFKYYFDY